MIREALGVNIAARDDVVHLSGDEESVQAARRVFERLGDVAGRSQTLSRREVLGVIADVAADARTMDEMSGEPDEGLLEGPDINGRLSVYSPGRGVTARSINQQHYLDAIRDNDLVFCTGPAGAGKTYLAVAAAVHLLRAGRVRKVVLTRPAVEAGEKLGFLPGDLQAKVNPYLRPLFDALSDMMDYGTLKRFIMNDVVEVAPLAYMRGRTLNNAVIILDEAQNTSRVQMKMFLTRIGERSRAIVVGDPTQTDLPDARDSGLIDAVRRLRRTPGIGFVALEKVDIVRHHLVQRIVEAYGEDEPREPLH
ncbi:MAG: PhoH family protein [Phycisphaerales bacterium]|nr:PhoH family protein [Phycisphaerales bacterium]